MSPTEKYKGSALLQKKFTTDFLTKRMKPNEGEVPQFVLENSHPAIIYPEEWDRVQNEIVRRKATGRHHNSLSSFSAKIICGDCGEYYGSKVWHSNSNYRRTIWQCNAKFKGADKCRAPHLYEDDIKAMFLKAVSELMIDREALIDDGRVLHTAFTDLNAIDKEVAGITVRLMCFPGWYRSWLSSAVPRSTKRIPKPLRWLYRPLRQGKKAAGGITGTA